jgi:hypothetical protein
MRNFMKFFFSLLILLFLVVMALPSFAQDAYKGIAQRPSASPLIYGIFDLPDGTTITGTTLESGNSAWSNIGAGTFQAINGEGTNGLAGCTPAPSCSNTYNEFPNTATLGGTPVPITSQGGSFRIEPAGAGAMPLTLIADMCGSGMGGCTPFTNFLHLNFGQGGWALTYCVTGSCPAGFNVLGSGTYLPLTIGAAYQVSWDIDEVNHQVTIHLPDGTNGGPYSFPASLAPIIDRFQIGGFSNPLSARWLNVWSGQSKAEAMAAAGRAAPMIDVTTLRAQNNQNGSQKSGLTLGTAKLFATVTMASAQFGDRVEVNAQTVVESSALPGVALDIEDVEVPVFSTGCCNQMGPVKVKNSDPQNSSGVCFTSPISASLAGTPGYGYTVSLYATPNVYGGCPNNSYITGARLNWTVKVQGDPGAVITPQ